MAKRENDVLLFGQVIGNLILSGHITYTAYSWASGMVDIKVHSDCFKEKDFILAVKEDDWKGGSSEAVRCGLLNRWRQGKLEFEAALYGKTTVKKRITDLRDKTLSHYRNSISRSRYEEDLGEILQLCDENELFSYSQHLLKEIERKTKPYVVCMNSDRIRDTQMLDTSSFLDKELSQEDPFSQEIEAFWHDMNVTPFIGVFVAKDEQEACEIAAKEYSITSGTKSMDVKIKVPRAGNANKEIRLVAYGAVENFPGNLLWVTSDRTNSQDIVYWANETRGQTETSINMNTPKFGWIEIKKEDIETGDKEQGDATLKGMTVEIVANENIPDGGIRKGDVVQTLKLNGTTTVRSKDLYEGSYLVRETGVPTGYVINTKPVGVTVVADETQKAVIKDTVIKAPVSIVKFLDKPLSGEAENPQIKEPEVNAKFEVRLKSTGVLYDTITTDKNGYAKTKPLPYGIYEVKQVSGKV